MYIGVIFLSMGLGLAAAVVSLFVGYSFWIALAVYSAVGFGGMGITVVVVGILPTARAGQLPARHQTTSG